MSDTHYLKGPCQHCGGSIEFPSHGMGLAIDCPHCAQKTVLAAPTAATPPPLPAMAPASSGKKKSPLLWIASGVSVLAVVGVGGMLLSRPKPSAPAPDQATAKPAAPAAAAPVAEPVAAATPAPKSLDDLKLGAITLEKARSGSLVYAVGVLKNDSDQQRFGVKVEIELTDAKGQRAGKTTDYTQVIEPRKEWRFRALVLEARAVSARLASVSEDP